MSKYTYKELIKILKDMGATQKRKGKGSHEIWEINSRIVSVPKHNEIKKGTYEQIIKKARSYKGE